MGAPGARRRARSYALQVLYALDLNPSATADEALAEFWEAFERAEGDAAAREFAESLVRATAAHRAVIDDHIQRASKNWRLDRMSRVDRNILRLATAELLTGDEVPVSVVINEAVELAKRFGAQESPAFVNGILDRIASAARG
ncbi:MAG: transcription antitermination factor NusB [Deltaproteobacteria bacterium]|nr:MAG: transcription antitermination factor NusB [Deltaproteobacteria bacterium]